MSDTSLDPHIIEAARNADANGYSAWTSAHDLAEDMCSYDATIEGFEVEDVESAIVRLGILEQDEHGVFWIKQGIGA